MLICFLLTILLMSATRVSAEVIWRGDFETGNTEQLKSTPKADGIKVVTEPVREGKYALRIDGTKGLKSRSASAGTSRTSPARLGPQNRHLSARAIHSLLRPASS